MIARLVAILGNLVGLVVSGHIHLASEYRLEWFQPLFFPALVDAGTIVGELLYAKHHSVVGDGHAPHAVGNSLVNNFVNLRLPVENGIMCVDV